MEEKTRDPIRFWGGVLGAAALAMAIVVAVVVQVQRPKPETAAKTQAAVRTQASLKKQAGAKPPAAVKPLTDAERRISEELWAEQKKLDADSARVATTSDGRRRVAETIAKQFNVSQKLVNELRGSKTGYGEVTVALALSQQLMKRDKVTHQKALDSVLGLRESGQGWGAIARSLGLKLSDVVGDVKKTDKQLAKLETGKSAKASQS